MRIFYIQKQKAEEEVVYVKRSLSRTFVIKYVDMFSKLLYKTFDKQKHILGHESSEQRPLGHKAKMEVHDDRTYVQHQQATTTTSV